MSGITRTDLQRHDLSAPGREVIQNRVGISPEAPLVKHWHPGEEIIYVLEGARWSTRSKGSRRKR
jgi:quercetin dioxygenase-like cupin family protein